MARDHVLTGNDHEDDAMNEQRIQALTEHEVAQQLGLSVATLRAWRLRDRGPRFVRFGRAVRYLAADIDRFVEASRIDRGDRHFKQGARARNEANS